MEVTRLKVSTKLVQQAVKDDDMLEALAVAILIKRYNKGSYLANATVRTVKDYFHVGTKRALRILNELIGYQERKETGVCFEILKKDRNGQNNIHALRIRATTQNKHNFNIDLINGKKYTVSDIMDILRSCKLANSIKQQSYVVDTIETARSPESTQDYRKAKKRLARLDAKRTSKSDYSLSNYRSAINYGFSYSAVMRATNTTRYKAKKLILGLVKAGVVLSKEIHKSTNIPAKEFNQHFKYYFRKYIGVGRPYVRRCEETGLAVVWIQLANQYQYVGDIID